MDLPELTIFDVGHGNCALLRDGKTVYVIDVPQSDAELVQALASGMRDGSMKDVDAILISHSDEDHAAGAAALITDETLVVKRLYVNPDSEQDSRAWESLRVAVGDAERRRPGEFEAHTQLTTTSNPQFSLPSVKVEVLAPSPSTAMGGPGAKSLQGRRLSSNGMSAVVRVSRDKKPGVLFTGDLDRNGLEALLAAKINLRAEVLVFPHHGGLPGGANARGFAARLTAAVKPEVIVFSLRSERHNPRPEIVEGIRERAPKAHIACTQLSGQCAAKHPQVAQDYLSKKPARGQADHSAPACCAGTLEFLLSPAGLDCPQLEGHAAWVSENVPDRICASDESGDDSTEPKPLSAVGA
jgi:beta-lactamase superfamily II metal-dependent hydrolase